MVKLTEDMVVARSKGAELHNVKKLNCWGSELTNISVVRKLPNVEVLSLSVNKIATLEDFQYCANLQELYIRKNNIKDINEVLYLRNIPKLKSLWLADNPCAEFDEYRLTILRTLPHLQKLDNVEVEPEEVQQSMANGLRLPLPDSNISIAAEPSSEEVTCDNQRSESAGGNSSISDSSPSSGSNPPHAQNLNGSTRQTSLEDPYESYPQQAYEEEQQSRMRRSSSQHETETASKGNYAPSTQAQNGIFIESAPNPTQTPILYEYIDNEGGRINSNAYSSSGGHRRQALYNNRPSFQPQQSSSRRSSHSDVAPSETGTRPFSRSSTSDYTVCDAQNANYSAPQRPDHFESPHGDNRRASREHQQQQCRESWGNDSDGYTRGYNNGRLEERREEVQAPRMRNEGYGSARNADFYRSPSAGEARHFSQRPASVADIMSQQDYRRVDPQLEAVSRGRVAPTTDISPQRPYTARPKTRSGNVLSAILCLIKELDYASLEVVEMATRCRMEEIDERS